LNTLFLKVLNVRLEYDTKKLLYLKKNKDLFAFKNALIFKPPYILIFWTSACG
jgi:hypothetical protein